MMVKLQKNIREKRPSVDNSEAEAGRNLPDLQFGKAFGKILKIIYQKSKHNLMKYYRNLSL